MRHHAISALIGIAVACVILALSPRNRMTAERQAEPQEAFAIGQEIRVARQTGRILADQSEETLSYNLSVIGTAKEAPRNFDGNVWFVTTGDGDVIAWLVERP